MPDVIRVATAQMSLRPAGSFDEFTGQVQEIVRASRAAGAELTLLPELATTGLIATVEDYRNLGVKDMGQAFQDAYPKFTIQYQKLLVELAHDYEMTICGGSHWRKCEDGKFRNTACMASPDGVLFTQDKLHPTKPEREIDTAPGDDFRVVDAAGTKVAILICADVEFPEVARAAAYAGAEILLVPSLTYNRRGYHRVRYSALARSVENQVFVLVSPLVGGFGVPPQAPLNGTGTALVTCPIDKIFGIHDGILASGDESSGEFIIADLDLSKLVESRAHSDGPRLSDTRPDLYVRLAKDAVRS